MLKLTSGIASLACLLLIGAATASAQPDQATSHLDQSVQKGIAFLRQTQSSDGSWTASNQPGITALIVYSLLASDLPVDDPTVAAGLKHLESHLQPDGGIYAEGSSHKNYETSIALMALTAADQDGRYRDVLTNAVAFLKKLQWDEEEVDSRDHTSFGGAGYGRHSRPDLSNTTFFLEALRTAGLSASEPSVQNALVFVSRCQNYSSEHNNTPFADKINDGGFYYTPAAGGSSQAGQTPDGGLRSYASMTYAGLKSMIYAGLTADDPRVKAAQEWIRKFYSLEENPGMGQMGLYYYYQTFAKTFDTLGIDMFEDAAGVQHDWRKELTEHLVARQRENGSWLNEAERWYEGDPNLATAYALISLSYCR